MTVLRALLAAAAVVLAAACAVRPAPKPAADDGLPGIAKPIILWLDWASAKRLDSETACDALAQRAQSAGVTHIALESRDAAGGDALAANAKAAEWIARAAKRARLRLAAVHACFLGEGERPLRAEWNGAAWELKPPAAGLARVSPVSPAAQQREIDALAALSRDRRFDTIILAGFGFGGVLEDLGPEARRRFEASSGLAPRNWPADVLGAAPQADPIPTRGGPFWNNWVYWRAFELRSLMVRMRAALPDAGGPRLVVLADAPFAAHTREGLNWSSADAPILSDFPYLPRPYPSTGIGHLVDGVAQGFWAPDLLTGDDAKAAGYAWWASVEGSAGSARRYLSTQTALWAAIPMADGRAWPRTVRAARQLHDGMVLLGAGLLEADGPLLREALRGGAAR